MVLKLGLVAALSLMMWSCSDDEEKTQEPVAAEGEAGKLPDAPGMGAEPAMPADPSGQVAMDPGAAPAGDAYGNAGGNAGGGSSPATTASAPAGGEDMTVKVGALNVRKGPGTKHAVVRTLRKGEKVQSWGCEKNWCKIGEGEYVSKKFLKK